MKRPLWWKVISDSLEIKAADIKFHMHYRTIVYKRSEFSLAYYSIYSQSDNSALLVAS